MQPRGEPLLAEQWAELIGGWFLELSDPAARASTWPLIAPHQDRIKAWLDADVTGWPRSVSGFAMITGWRAGRQPNVIRTPECPIDVLAELPDHRSYSITRRYYNPREFHFPTPRRKRSALHSYVHDQGPAAG